MILKKPFAFLIKYYRIIHLALAFLLGVGAYKLWDVVKFFNGYVKNGYTTTVVTDLEKIYTPVSVYLIVILILALFTAIIVLLSYKKKPIKIYLISMLYYIIVLLGLAYISGVLQSFETELLASTTARSLRDILVIAYLPQFVFIVLILIRTVGFNIKKFDFADETASLSSGASDSEEVEINVNIPGYWLKQKANRLLREGIYYVKENKLLVGCALLIVIIASGIYIYNNSHGNYDTTYKMGETFIYEKMQITLKDAMVTNLDYNGDIIDNNYYVVVKTNVTNDSGYTVHIDYNNFKLMLGNELLTPSVSLGDHFIDYASGNAPLLLSHKDNKTFALVYKIKANQINKSMKIKIHTGSVYEKGEYIDKRIYINVKPKKIDDLHIAGNYKLNEKIAFEDTYLGSSTLSLNSFIVTDNYMYKYDVCVTENDCKTYTDAITVSVKHNRHDNKLLVLSADYILDKKTDYASKYLSLSSFVENFAKVQYKVGDEVYSNNSINVTPQKSKDIVAFEVPKDIQNASIIQIIVTVRNKEYIINLKVSN